jgi:hypothetical protein
MDIKIKQDPRAGHIPAVNEMPYKPGYKGKGKGNAIPVTGRGGP